MINQAVKEPICQSVKSSQALSAYGMANADGPKSPVTIIVYVFIQKFFIKLKESAFLNDFRVYLYNRGIVQEVRINFSRIALDIQLTQFVPIFE